ncbi:tail tape measure protein [Synechococcus phage Ssp-JY39]
MALAPLGFTVDTSPIAKAVGDLSSITAATATAEAASRSLTSGTNAAAAGVAKMAIETERARVANDNAAMAATRHAAAIAQLTAAEARNTAANYTARAADVAAYGAELDQLRAKFNPIFAASKRYEQELNELNHAHRIGAITAAEHGSALTMLNSRYQLAAGGATSFSSSAGMARAQTQNLMYQMQDIGTMLAMGQNPFMLLAQQLPQVTQHGGRLTGVMGALRQTLAGLFSPLGLLTTGFVLAGSAAVSYFSSASDNAHAAADALAEQADLIQRVADRWGDAMPALRAYSNELERQRDVAERSAASQAAINTKIDEAQAAYNQLRSIFADFRSQAETGGGFFDIEQASAAAAIALDQFAEAMQDGELSASEYQGVNEALSEVLSLDVVQANANVAKAIEGVIERLMAGAQAARTYAEELAAVSAGGPIGGERVAGGKGSRTGAPPLGEIDFASRFGWEDYFTFPRDRKPRRGRKTDEERSAERYAEMIRSSEQFIAMQELEQQALFMTEEAANALRYEQELLNQAANDNIKLTPEMAAELKGLAAQMAAAEAETERLNEAFRFVGDVARGFFDDVFSALDDGKTLWEGFAQAGLNALQRIADKLIDMAMDELITGLLGSILGAIGGGFPSLPSSAPIPTPRPFAKGGVISRPTLFPMANGAGLMGEAGPEAIMPLRRGPDGRLGVSAAANANAANQNVHVTVGVSVDRNGNLQAYVQNVAQERAVAVTHAGLQQFARNEGRDMVESVIQDRRARG